MNPQNPPTTINQQNDPPKARIHATDFEFVLPLRELLESFGCTILMDPSDPRVSDYLLVCGDVDFVKDFHAKPQFSASKILSVIFIDRDNPDIATDDIGGKIVLVDPKPLNGADVKNIFNFYFTGTDTLLNLSHPESFKNIRNAGEITEISNPHKPAMVVETYGGPVGVKNPDDNNLTKDISPSDNTPKILSNKIQSRISPSLDLIDLHPGSLVKDAPREEFVSSVTVKTDVAHSLHDRTRISHTIAEVFGSSKNSGSQDKKRHHHRKLSITGVMFLLLAAAVAPVAWYLVALTIAALSLLISYQAFLSGQISLARTSARLGSNWVKQSRGILTFMNFPLKISRTDRLIYGQEQLVLAAQDLADAAVQSTQLAQEASKLSRSMLGNLYGGNPDQSSVAQLIGTFKTEIPYIHDRLSLVSAQMSFLVRSNIFPLGIKMVRDRVNQGILVLDKRRNDIAFVSNLLTLYTSMGGFTQKKTYLILFQNNNELRPTGGFIGSYALVTFTDGKIVNLNIQDIYTADGQLKGHVDPPKPIRELLGQEHWYLRDSNWDPDFAVSGAQAAWFIQKETGAAVDGVIAVNSGFIVDILKATGPINLPDYHDQITADNFFGKSLYYVQNNFFPGSTQKKDFLGNLFQALITQTARESGATNSVALYNALQDAYKNHDIMVYSGDDNLQNLITQLGWSGKYPPALPCESRDPSACYADTIGFIEANLSVNKVNYFINKKIQTNINIDQNGIISTGIKVGYTNTAPDETIVGGNYRNYLRIYLPADARSVVATLDGQAIPEKSASMSGQTVPYLEGVGTTLTSRIVGIVFDVPHQSRKELVITYRRDLPVNPTENGTVYALVMPKQPGAGSSESSVTIKYPATWSGRPIRADGLSLSLEKEGELAYNSPVVNDAYINILFSK